MSLKKSIFRFMLLLLIGLLSAIVVQYTFKYRLSAYPIITTCILYTVIGYSSKYIYQYKSKLTPSYLLIAIPLIIIQLYGLKINYQGLKLLSPTLIIISMLSLYVGVRLSVSARQNSILMLICLIIGNSLIILFFIPFTSFNEKMRVVNKRLPYKLELIDSNRKIINMAQYDNKVLIICFWDSRCSYCFKMIPYIEKIRSKLDTNQVFFLEVNTGKTDSFDKFLEIVSKNETLKKLNPCYDPNSVLANKLSVQGLPHYFIVKNHSVLYEHVGFYEDEGFLFVQNNINLIKQQITP